MKNNLLKSVILSVILLMGVSNAWAWWFVPGSWNGWDEKEANSGGVAQMNGSNTITFYNVPAGSYKMKLKKEGTWGNGNYTNKSNNYITSVTNGNGSDDQITLSKACDLTFTITNQDTWLCDVSASDPSYYIKYNWNGSGWAWSGALTASNNYSCTGQYGGSASFDHTRKSSTNESGTNAAGTTANSPTKGDKCVFTYNTSTKALTITRCNKANQGKIYFDNSKTNWTNSNIYFIIGYDKPTAYSKVYKMSNISNTLLWYTDLGTDNWDDATYYAFIAADNEWSNGNWGSSNLSSAQHYTAAYTAKYDLGNNGCYYFTPKTGDNNTTFTIEYKANYSNIQKYTAKQAAKTRNTINDSYTEVNGTWPTALKLQGTHLTGFGATNSGRNEISGSSSSGTNSYDAVTTGKITHTYNTISGNYIFEGWGTGSTPSTTNASYEYNITANTTVYAFFTKAHTVTYSCTPSSAANAPATTPSVASGSLVASGTSVTFTAQTANTDYTWKGWYDNDEGTGVALTTDLSYTRSIDELTTIYAVYMSAVTLDNQGITTDGTFSATATKACKGEEITLTATAAECYEFVSWTIKKTSDGNDVTKSVLNGNTLTMPDYAVTVYATFKSLSVTEIKLSMTGGHKNLDVGETNQLLVTYTPADATCDKAIVSWTSSDDNVMSVTSDGLVKALRAGNATITATTAGGVTATYTITINNPDCASWYLHYWNQSRGGDECFYKVKPDDPNDHEWRTNNFSLPSISNEDKFIVNNTPEDPHKTDQVFRTGIGFADIQRGGQDCGTNPYPGQDAYGQLSIYDDSETANRYIAFYPAQYLVTYGKDGTAPWEVLPLNNTTGYEYETEPFMVPNGYDTYKYYVGITDKNGNIKYVGYEFGGEEYKKSSVDPMNTVNGLSANDMAGKWGTWHIYSNSCANNWYCEFIHYYRVEFNLNGGEGDFAPRYDKATTPYVTFTTTDIGAPTRTGYTFLGWKDQNNKIYAPTGATVIINDDFTLTALWKENYASDNCRWEEVTIDDIEYGDEVVVAMETATGTYALNSENGTTGAPEASIIHPEGNKISTDEVASYNSYIIWNIEKDGDNLIFHPFTEPNKNLYCNTAEKDNNRVRVGSLNNAIINHKFIISGNHLQNSITNHYLGIYYSNGNAQDWRGYLNSTQFAGQTLKFYKKVCLPENEYWVDFELENVECTSELPKTIDVANGNLVLGFTAVGDHYELPSDITIIQGETTLIEGTDYTWAEGKLTIVSNRVSDNVYISIVAQLKKYTVSFEMNGHGIPIDPQQVTAGEKANCPENPTDDSHNFIGWFADNECTTPFDFSTPIYNPITIYAKWDIKTYTINWSANGDITPEIFNHGDALTIPVDIEPCQGMTLVGWITNETYNSPTTAPTYIEEGTPVTSPATYYAVYAEVPEGEPIEEITETYIFENYTAGTQYAEDEEHILDEYVTIYTTQCYFTKKLRIYSSSTHNGYVVSNKLPGKIVSMGFNAGDNNNDNLVVFGSTDGNDWQHVGSIKTKSVYADYSLSFDQTNYTYFKLDVEGSNPIRITSMTITYMSGSGEPSAAYANYSTTCSATYRVSYDFAEGEGICTSERVKEGNDYTICADEPTKTGYSFLHWVDEEENTYKAGDVIENVQSNINLTAIWKANEYTITWMSNGEQQTQTTHIYDQPLQVAEAPFNCYGVKTFVGWTEADEVSEDGEGIEYITTSTNPCEDKIYHAVFAEEVVGESSTPETILTNYTTTPTGCAEMVAENAYVTSASGQSVKVNVPVKVNFQDGYTIEATLNDGTKFEVVSVSEITDNKATVTLAYTPDYSDDTENTSVQLTAKYGENFVTAKSFTVNGRSLPETFAVVAKVGNMWYALPEVGYEAEKHAKAYPVEVDNIDDPKEVTSALVNNAVWSLRQVYEAQHSNAQYDRYVTSGHNIVLENKQTPAKLLNASAQGDKGTNNYLLTAAQYDNYYSTNPGLYEWTPTTTDLKTYTLTNVRRTDKQINISTSAAFGLHAADVVTDEVRFLPIQNTYTLLALQVVEWKKNSVVIMYNGDPAQPAQVSIQGNSVGSATLSSVQKDIAVYELPATGLDANPGQMLKITIGQKQLLLSIPYIISESKVDKNILPGSNVGERQDVAKVSDVVILKDGTLTADGAKTNSYKFRNVTVYGGGKLVVPADRGFGVNTLTLRIGGVTDGTYDYVYPEFLLNINYNNAFTNTSGKINLDYVTTKEQYYTFVAPFAVQTKDIHYPVDIYGNNVAADNTGSFEFQYYDGAARAAGEKGWKVVEEDPTEGATLTAHKGYTFYGMPKKVSVNGGTSTRQRFGIHRIPMSIGAAKVMEHENTAQTTAVSAYPSQYNINAGWNLIGNPYMSTITGLNNESIVTGTIVLVDDRWQWSNDDTYNQRFIVFPSNDGEWYYTSQASNATLPAFKNFFVQIDNDANALSIPYTHRASGASAPARRLAEDMDKDIELAIVLEQDDKFADQMDFLLNDAYSAVYDRNADFTKMMNNTQLNLYGVLMEDNLSFVALDHFTARGSIAIGYQVPSAGEYTLRISDKPYVMLDKIEALYVTDHEMNPAVTTNLMEEDYVFQVRKAEINDTRFTISLVAETNNNSGDVTTDLGELDIPHELPQKFLYNGRLYILRKGKVYTATGHEIKTINE